MKKLKSSDDRVSFRLKKESVLKELSNNLDIIKGYSINNVIKFKDLEPIIKAMEDVLASVKSLGQFGIWDTTAKKSFSKLLIADIQIKKMRAEAHNNPEDKYTGYTSGDISDVLNDFSEQLKNIINIVKNQT